jgi:type II secretion system protein G
MWALILIPIVLILTCVIGIIASIAIPNLVQATGRGKQKRAVAEVRSIGTACEAYATDHGAYPDTGKPVDAYYGFVEADKLKSFLEPTYTAAVPTSDPWGHPYLYGISQDGSEYIVICTGSDGENKLEAVPESPAATGCFEDEIVLENGSLLRYPDGPQKKCQ